MTVRALFSYKPMEARPAILVGNRRVELVAQPGAAGDLARRRPVRFYDNTEL